MFEIRSSQDGRGRNSSVHKISTIYTAPKPPPHPQLNPQQLEINLMHDNRNMIIHILADIARKASRDDTDDPEGNTRIINVLVALRIRHLARLDDDLVGGLVVADAGDLPETVEHRRARQHDGLGDVGDVRDAELADHGTANVVFRPGDKLVEEDVVLFGGQCVVRAGYMVGGIGLT